MSSKRLALLAATENLHQVTDLLIRVIIGKFFITSEIKISNASCRIWLCKSYLVVA